MMEALILETLSMDKNKASGCINERMDRYMKENGRQTLEMGKAR